MLESKQEIKGKYHVPASVSDFDFARGVDDWERQSHIVNIPDKLPYTHEFTKAEWDALGKVMLPIYQAHPEVTDVTWPKFKEDL